MNGCRVKSESWRWVVVNRQVRHNRWPPSTCTSARLRSASPGHARAGKRRARRRPAIAEAYAGPLAALRKDIPLQAPVVATVKHGERLEIVHTAAAS